MVKRKGYTLTEALMTVAILGIVASLSAPMLIQVNRYWSLTTARVDLQREARAAMYVITRALRQAQYSTITLDRYASTQPFFSRVSFTTIQGKSRSFYQSGNQLVQSGGQPQILSKNLRYLAFTFPRSDDMTILSVALTLEKSIFEGRKKALHMASEKVQVMNP
jgi:prepilin-type N-terminal cleavage/methylation domain-containing protein